MSEKSPEKSHDCCIDDNNLEDLQNKNVENMDKVWSRPKSLIDIPNHYCPGCGHSVVHKLLMEVVEELGIVDRTIGIAPVGCSVFAYNYLDVDMQQAAHGRATAAATGIKRVLPDKIVFTYQGDGDLAAIGTAETIHSVNRGENFVIIFINNGIYGMTGGQMAPTTLEGSVTSTTPTGREIGLHGYPIKIAEMLALLPGAYYITRQAVISAKHVRKTKKALKKAFTYQIEGKGGISFVEVVSNCPSGWKMTPIQSNRWIEDTVFDHFPLGDIKLPKKG